MRLALLGALLALFILTLFLGCARGPRIVSPYRSQATESVAQEPIAQGPIVEGPIAQGPIAQGPIAQGPIAQGAIAEQDPCQGYDEAGLIDNIKSSYPYRDDRDLARFDVDILSATRLADGRCKITYGFAGRGKASRIVTFGEDGEVVGTTLPYAGYRRCHDVLCRGFVD